MLSRGRWMARSGAGAGTFSTDPGGEGKARGGPPLLPGRGIRSCHGWGGRVDLMFMQLDIPPGDFSGYIFDLDGTLVDTMPLHYLAWDEAMRDAGLKERLDENLFYSLGGVPTTRVAELMGSHYGLSLDPLAVMHQKEALYLQLVHQAEPIAPVVAFLERVAATRPCAIATGGTPEVALPALDAAGLRGYFQVIVTPLDVPAGRGKPAPDMFLLAASRMGVRPAECLVFEDAEPGIRAARAAGMQVVHVPSRRQDGTKWVDGDGRR